MHARILRLQTPTLLNCRDLNFVHGIREFLDECQISESCLKFGQLVSRANRDASDEALGGNIGYGPNKC